MSRLGTREEGVPQLVANWKLRALSEGERSASALADGGSAGLWHDRWQVFPFFQGKLKICVFHEIF